MASALNVNEIAPESGSTVTITGLTLPSPLSIASGGTGVATLAIGGLVTGNGTSAVVTVAAGATTEILVGGGASTVPVWTTATGTGAPVRATAPSLSSPVLTTPALGTPSSGVLTNCTGYPGTSLTVIDAKGDLIVGTAADTAAKLTVGTAGMAPVSDSNATTGLAYGFPALPGYIYGLTLSNDAGDTANDIGIAIGAATDTTFAWCMQLSSALVKRLDASWSVGTANGMLDGTESVAGTPDTSTWYHIWLIRRPDTGVVDILASESATAPTMPTNYTQKRRIGAVYNNSGGDIDQFIQYGSQFMWITKVSSFSGASSAAAANVVLRVPTGVRNLAQILATAEVTANDGVSDFISYYPVGGTAVTPGLGNAHVVLLAIAGVSEQWHAVEFQIITDTSSQIVHDATGTDTNEVILTLGWRDERA